MFDITRTNYLENPHGLDTAVFDSEVEIAQFLSEHADALRNAGYCLGGAAGLHLADAVITGVGTLSGPTRAERRRRERLLDLLRLDNVDVPCSVEAAQFALIDPADPVVEEICLLADRFADLLRGAHSVANAEGDLAAETERRGASGKDAPRRMTA